MKPDMSVRFAGMLLRNPILAASGTFGYGVEFEDVVSLERIGGFITKGLSREPMAGNQAPRLIETPGGFDYTGADCVSWMKEAGFRETRVEHLIGPDSMVVGIK